MVLSNGALSNSWLNWAFNGSIIMLEPINPNSVISPIKNKKPKPGILNLTGINPSKNINNS